MRPGGYRRRSEPRTARLARSRAGSPRANRVATGHRPLPRDPGDVRTTRALAPAWYSRKPVGYLLVAVVAGVLALWSATVAVRHGRQPVYDMPPAAVVLAAAGTALAVIGAGGMIAVRRHDVALLSGLVALALILGVLTLFSVGVLFILVGGGLVIVLARRASGGGPWAAASGVAMAAGVAITALVALQPPMVSCLSNGTRISSSIWSGGTATGSGTSSTGPGYSTGTFIRGSTTYSFTCRAGRLVEFRSVATPGDEDGRAPSPSFVRRPLAQPLGGF